MAVFSPVPQWRDNNMGILRENVKEILRVNSWWKLYNKNGELFTGDPRTEVCPYVSLTQFPRGREILTPTHSQLPPAPVQFSMGTEHWGIFVSLCDVTEVNYGSWKSSDRKGGLEIMEQQQTTSPELWVLPPLTRFIYKTLYCVRKSSGKKKST